jgi:ribosomal protein S18 acetylase RimI-like enzyme
MVSQASPAVRIREVSEYPVEKIAELLRAVYGESDFMCQSFADRYPDLAAVHEEMREPRRDPRARFMVAEDAEGLAGYVQVSPKRESRLRHTATLNMGVLARARGRGVGRLLLRSALEAVERAGSIEILYLMVRADNVAAIRLYEGAGFEKLATLERDTRIGDRYFDGILMRGIFKN